MMLINIQFILLWSMITWMRRFEEVTAQSIYPEYENRPRGKVYFAEENRFRGSRGSTELPVSFKAPNLESKNYWNYDRGDRPPDRRTFFDSLGQYTYGRQNMFPDLRSFFEFMNPFLEDRVNLKPTSSTVPKVTSEPYKFENPYNYHSSAEKTFLPPPKPIRASIVKLETVANAPTLPPLTDHLTPSTEYYPKFSNILPRPVDRPVLHIDGLGFRPIRNFNIEADPTPTQYFNDSTESSEVPVFLPISTEVGDIKEATEEQARMVQIVTDLTAAKQENANSQETVVDQDSHTNETDIGLVPIDVDIKTNNDKERSNLKNNDDIILTSILSKPRGNEEGKIRGDAALKNYKEGSSIKIVTDLTLRGLQKNKKQTANIPRYTKVFNMSGLIDYELNKLKHSKVLKPRSDDPENDNDDLPPLRSINQNDELSLDLKILKDTHWDGFTTESSDISISDPPTSAKPNQTTTTTTTEMLDPEKEAIVTTTESVQYHNRTLSKTTIVETRVTKTVSKVSPTHHQKYRKTNGIKRQNHLKDRNQASEQSTKSEIVSQVQEPENATGSSTEHVPNDLNATSTTPGRNSSEYQQSEEVQLSTTPRYRRRKYKFDSRNSTFKSSFHKKHDVSTSTTENNPVQGTDKPFDSSLENTTDLDSIGLTTQPVIPASTDSTTDVIKMKKRSRRRKPKRTTKSKRRRTNQRRQQIDER